MKTKVYVSFGARLPLSKAPVSLVTVWVVESLFVQVTESPALIVMVDGEKVKLLKVTKLLEADGEDVVGEGVPYPDEHATMKMETIRIVITDISEDA